MKTVHKEVNEWRINYSVESERHNQIQKENLNLNILLEEQQKVLDSLSKNMEYMQSQMDLRYPNSQKSTMHFALTTLNEHEASYDDDDDTKEDEHMPSDIAIFDRPKLAKGGLAKSSPIPRISNSLKLSPLEITKSTRFYHPKGIEYTFV